MKFSIIFSVMTFLTLNTYPAYSSNVDFRKALGSNDFKMIVELMNNDDVNINEIDVFDQNRSALIKATVEGRLDVVKLLVKHPRISRNLRDFSSNTALILASRWGHVEIVEELLKHPRPGINFLNFHNQSSLSVASARGHIEVVRLLLQQPDIKVDRMRFELPKIPLIVAAENGQIEVMRELLAHPDVVINSTSHSAGAYTALIKASEIGNLEAVELLLERDDIDVNLLRSNFNSLDDTALSVALKNNHVHIVKKLIRHPGTRFDTLPNPKALFLLDLEDIVILGNLRSPGFGDLLVDKVQDRDAAAWMLFRGFEEGSFGRVKSSIELFKKLTLVSADLEELERYSIADTQKLYYFGYELYVHRIYKDFWPRFDSALYQEPYSAKLFEFLDTVHQLSHIQRDIDALMDKVFGSEKTVHPDNIDVLTTDAKKFLALLNE